MMSEEQRKPVVFISSTVEDLKPYRDKARDAAIRAGFFPEMQEYFVARDNPPFSECMQRIAKTDVLVTIVAHRYGWVPADQPGQQAKSITWLECEKAVSAGKDVLAFIVDPNCEWPLTLKEEHRLTVAIKAATPGLLAEVQRNVDKLEKFKGWLRKDRVRATFSTPDGLRAEVEAALRTWLKEHLQPIELPRPQTEDRPHGYLSKWTPGIDLRGLGRPTIKRALWRGIAIFVLAPVLVVLLYMVYKAKFVPLSIRSARAEVHAIESAVDGDEVCSIETSAAADGSAARLWVRATPLRWQVLLVEAPVGERRFSIF